MMGEILKDQQRAIIPKTIMNINHNSQLGKIYQTIWTQAPWVRLIKAAVS